MNAPAFLRGVDMPGVITPWHGKPADFKLIVDFFAGGGGASKGIEMALGRSPDIAVNHDAEAIAMHRVNHPDTLHLQNDVWSVMPALVRLIGHRRVGLFHASPDCKHFSKAKGGKPVKRKIRDLAWVVPRFCKRFRPEVVTLENVEEFAGWGPLVQKVAADGRGLFDTQGRPVMVPCKKRKGQTFQQWVAAMQRLGYRVAWRELRACDNRAPTIRKRLFVVARCDGLPIEWPAAECADPKKAGFEAKGLAPYRTAAECIDWSLPCPSIFATAEEVWAEHGIRVKRPLAAKTMARIAKGIFRFVINNPKPFIINLTHQGGDRLESIEEPFRTVTGAHRGEKAVVMPHVTRFNSGAVGTDVGTPLPTVTANSFIKRPGGSAPLGLVTAHVLKQNHGDKPASAADEPLHTIVAGGQTQAVVETTLAGPFVAGVGGRMGQTEPRSTDAPTQTVTAKADSVLVTPVVVRTAHGDIDKSGKRRSAGAHDASAPLPTQLASPDYAVAVPTLIQMGYGERPGQDPRVPGLDKPLGTVVAGGIKHAVVAPIVTRAQHGGGVRGADDPLHTATASRKDQNQVVVPHLMTMRDAAKPHNEADKPAHTICAGGARLHLVAAFLAQHNGGMVGHDARDPVSTIVQKGCTQAVVSAGLINHKASDLRQSAVDEPTRTKTAESPQFSNVAAFLTKYHGSGGQHAQADEPLRTIDTEDRLALCTVMIGGEPWLIVDIGMRMLTPRELFAAQGFPPSYIIDRGLFEEHGRLVERRLTSTAQVRMCGNSVSPEQERALIGANCRHLAVERRAA